jgi:hypothetical protein
MDLTLIRIWRRIEWAAGYYHEVWEKSIAAPDFVGAALASALRKANLIDGWVDTIPAPRIILERLDIERMDLVSA